MKLSGCFSEMPDSLKNAPVDEVLLALQPYLVVILATFGASRIMFGSDWPLCSLACDYGTWFDLISRFIAPLSESEQARILGGTAVEVYGL